MIERIGVGIERERIVMVWVGEKKWMSRARSMYAKALITDVSLVWYLWRVDMAYRGVREGRRVVR